ncbi:MAG: hypothetical protein WAS21_32030 [Geminicoccaceae bacterium]
MFKFTPTGQTFPGSPYKGSGIEGDGFGITFDPKGRIWLGNFGFQSPVCGEGPKAASNDSVTIYPNGDPKRARNLHGRSLGLDKPFDVAIDGRGRAWVTGNDSENVAIIDGDRIRQVGGQGFNQPMGIASDTQGNMWSTNSALVDVPCPDGGFVGQQYGGSIILVTKDGRIAPGSPFTGGGVTSPGAPTSATARARSAPS